MMKRGMKPEFRAIYSYSYTVYIYIYTPHQLLSYSIINSSYPQTFAIKINFPVRLAKAHHI